MWRIIYNSSVVYHRPVWVLRSAVTSAAEHWYWLGLAWLSRCATLRMCFVVLKELGTILLVVGYFLQWKMCEAQFVVLPSHSFGCGLTVDYSLAGLVNSIALKVTEHRGTNAVVISSLPCQVWRVLGNLFDKQFAVASALIGLWVGLENWVFAAVMVWSEVFLCVLSVKHYVYKYWIASWLGLASVTCCPRVLWKNYLPVQFPLLPFLGLPMFAWDEPIINFICT